ncbi:phosphotransferase family protein [Thermoflavimicrobium dichotomicum]|uniref:Predicted kinase, aminoglycoside phosphotransferase (APT) family n=1 Tax=Thermoflavimicrobium dichotomicum TaxID=46223 RepID=A0A1I3P5K4_9BACL|nr:phosphotransferase family protein [Thermoflavimicrobium dichotomicum]SFJ16326.1 Predicted kinase, aminoglycoside phosphotransferase (APT) family [Thermoflavimicrobium dichotomicum]
MGQGDLQTMGSTPEIKWDQIERFVRFHVEGLSEKPMQVKQCSAGYSNLTYLIRIGDWEGVLRRPPFGTIPPKAHDMEREYRILKKLHLVFPLAPKPYLYCEDPEIMDKHFYIMERKQGVVLDEVMPPEWAKQEEICRIISETVVNTLVQLHDIDYREAGLSDIGRPEGFLERQVHGWIKRYQNAKTDEIRVTGEIEKWLLEHIPASPSPTIIHNDFKLNNMMLSPNDPSQAVAVLDWEMCTIGDPLMDLGVTLAYWTEEGEAETGLTSITKTAGFIKRREFIDLYAQKSGRDLSHIHYYVTFAFYKIAAVLQQIYFRWKKGETKDQRFSKLNVGIGNLMEQAYRTLRKELF